MSSITSHYGIARPVPFLDVDVHGDTKLFVDPHVIRLEASTSTFARDAVRSIDSFFDVITGCVRSSDPGERARGQALLGRFREPSETRLGMCASGFNGHGGAGEIGAEIWTTLSTDLRALVDVGILKHVEHLPLFVDGVDADITSDLTTRIIFDPLAEFTSSVVAAFPEFTAGCHDTDVFDRQVWDPTVLDWATRRMELPIADGRPLLLIPVGWARSRLLLRATRYYECAVIGFAQDERTVILKDGSRNAPVKKSLWGLPGLERGRATNVDLTMEAFTSRGINLIDEFTGFADRRFRDERRDVAGAAAA